ncbi:uncharacterized protein LOC110441521 [Mizuhopecten yessoensis]|uniref:Mitochondrial ribonuclease P protein 3 n=1 Tax=Mizuhopecten yessoensis TaxID=6573 RepID=A0A210PJ77_MIZYE|nr:uncharacterized protein LOC110441521 [Mizuhopecten yessoensis]OWF36541.1 Mitochondrial ribonuclease P protein 3 [Mizuhopecten yessoensis]
MFLKISMYRQTLIQLCTYRFGCFKTPVWITGVVNPSVWTSPTYNLQFNRTLSHAKKSALQGTIYNLKAPEHMLKLVEKLCTEGQPIDVPFLRSSLKEKGLYHEEFFPYFTLSVADRTNQTQESIETMVQDLASTQFGIPELSILIKIYGNHGLENLVLSTYDRMCEMSDGAFDLETLKAVISALSSTSKWRKCFRLLDLGLIINPESHISLINVLAAAAREGDIHTFCDLLVKMDNVINSTGISSVAQNLPILFTEKAVQSYLSSVDRGVEHFTFENLFYLMRKYKCCFKEMSIPSVITQLERSGYLAHIADLYNDKDDVTVWSYQRPNCVVCNSPLNRHELTIEEFEELRKAYFTLKGVNVYLKSKTSNVPLLRNLIQQKGPFDVVIDHLNTCIFGGKRDTEASLSIIKQLSRRGLSCLVVTRKDYFRSVPMDLKTELSEHATIFVSGTVYVDDLNILDAVFHCGFNTKVLSNDKFSDHSCQLGSKMQLAFQRWQSCRQITILGRSKLIFPESPDMLVQESEDGWHIPYGPTTSGLLDKKVLCVRRNSYEI